MNGDERFSSSYRLGSETGRVIKTGRRDYSGKLVLYFLKNSRPRFAAVAGIKVGSSVKRNLLKRRAREIFRKNRKYMKNYSLVVLFRAGSAGYTYEDIKSKMLNLCRKNSLIQN